MTKNQQDVIVCFNEFLIQHNAFESFILNFKNYRGSNRGDDKSISAFIIRSNYWELLDNAFSWSSATGDINWGHLNNLFQEEINRKGLSYDS